MANTFLAQLADCVANANGPFPAILNALPQAIFVFNADRRLLFANAAAEKALRGTVPGEPDSPPQETMDQVRGVFQFIDPATGQALPPEETPLARALRGESLEPQDYLIRRSDTAIRLWLEVSAHPVRDAEGAITAAVFAFRTISDRKKRELAQEAAGRLHDVIYQENLAGILRVGVDGRIIDCNDAIIRMLGYSTRAELLALRDPQIYFDPHDRDRLIRLLTAAQRLSRFEVCFRRSDGSRCWVLLNARLLEPPQGEIGGTVISIVIDISARKAQEETLRQSEERFAAFMSHLPGVAFIKDLTGKYVYYNDASTVIFGIRPQDITGKTDEIVWPEHAARYRASDRAVIDSGRPLECLEPVQHPDGTHSWLINKFPIMEKGKMALVGGVGIDITERTILEQQLNEARRIESLGRLAGGVAHDFNNLLTVIAGYGQLALETAGTSSNGTLATYLHEILDCSRRATGLTSQLLAFSRRQVSQPKVLNLVSLLQGMRGLLQRVLGELVELSLHESADNFLILADPNQMEQAIMNLAANARDAIPLGGHLDIRVERIEPIQRKDGAPLVILLEVRDDGIGMDEAVRARIFDPFFTSKEPGKGTGLGLSTVYGAITAADGRIEVESKAGAGTVFRLYFPEAQAGAEEPVRKPAGSYRGKETVLLVEDDASVRTLTKAILDRLGYNVLVAESGPEALGIWSDRSGAIDVLLTDVIMPQMSGGDLANRLRERQPRLRVLFMSGYTDDMIAGHGVTAGETQLIQKPFTAEALAQKLRGVLDA